MVHQSSKNFCGICLDFKRAADMFREGKCKHPFCIDCITKHVAAQIQQNRLEVKCPNPSCDVELKPNYLKSILPKEVIDRWEYEKCESSIALWQKIYCPFKDCSILLVNDGDGANVVTSCECPYCHRLFCAQCKVPWHAGLNCKEFQEGERREGEEDLDQKFLELANTEMWQKCPKCSFYVQRHTGCEHITCRCGCDFCYICGKDWIAGHVCNTLHAPPPSRSPSPTPSPITSPWHSSSPSSSHSPYLTSYQYLSNSPHRIRSRSPYSSHHGGSEFDSSYHMRHRSYSPRHNRHRSYSPSPDRSLSETSNDNTYESRDYSPDDRYYRPISRSGSPRPRRSYTPSISPRPSRRRRRSYSRSVTPVQRLSSRRGYSRSVSPRPRRSQRRSYSRRVSPRPRSHRRSYSRSVTPVQRLNSRRGYSRSVSPRPRRSQRRSYSRRVSPVQRLNSRRGYSRSVSPRPRRR